MENVKKIIAGYVDNWFVAIGLIGTTVSILAFWGTDKEAFLYFGVFIALITIFRFGYGWVKTKDKRIAQLEEENRGLKAANVDLKNPSVNISVLRAGLAQSTQLPDCGH